MKDTGDVYELWMPNTCIQNIILGKMYIDHYGTIKVINRSNGKSFELKMDGFSGLLKDKSSKGSVTGDLLESYGNSFLK